MNDELAKRVRLLASVLSVLLLLVVLAAGWFYFQLRGSLPQLDGTQPLLGLSAPVTIERDALGVPTIRGESRTDVAQALGFAHAQDRFFQMDLMRRRAAGELAELFGEAALPLDRDNRPHRFRSLAREVLAALPSADRALLESYAAGVNAGLRALGRKPFEYFVLRSAPELWRAEDSLLIAYTMTLDLQDARNTYERSLATFRDRYGNAAVAFFAPLLTPDDAAIDDSRAALPPIPEARLMNIREQRLAATLPDLDIAATEDFHPGSNSFALSGAHTANGAALLANDPHLNLSVPNIWYRAVLQWPGAADEPAHRVIGVTLPGLPLIVIGSNGHIAWGLTVAYADTNDATAIDVNAVSKNLYKLPGSDELHEIQQRSDTIQVKGETLVTVESSWTHWGPIIGTDSRERPLAHRWVAYDPTATNLNFARLETTRTAAEAIVVATTSGLPAQNFLVADRAGDIAWTIAGRIPRRVGFDGRFPVSWTFGDRYWDGFVAPAQVPKSISPASGRLWTANNRIVGGPDLEILGDGGYASPARAAQIRDRLAAVEQARPADLLSIALDDRALFLSRWQQLALATLTPRAIADEDSREQFRALVESWDARASVDSVGYRLVKEFRATVVNLALAPIFAPCVERMPDFSWRVFHYEPALWQLVQEKPMHFLPPNFESWDALLLTAVDRAIERIEESGARLERATWGDYNTARIRHPFSSVLPRFITSALNRPADPLPGDAHMPRIQSPSYGASMRLVVSPGHEKEGLFHMPGGQSGHPLSPFYREGHDAWVRGEPTPLLPGGTEHTLTLTP